MTQGHAEPGSADWFVDLASGSGVVFFALQVKPELRFEFINPAVEDLLGYSAEDVLSDPLVMLGRIDPRDAELLARDLEVEPGTHTVAEQRWTHRDGRTLLVRSTTRSVLRSDGSVLLEGTSQDMTSVRQVETELAHSEELYRLLAENAWDVIWTMGVDGSITYVSPSVERVRGITPEEAKSQTLDEIHPPESMASVLDYYTRLGAALQEGTEPPGFRGEHEYYRKDGSIMTGELQVIPHVDADGKVVEILGVTRDISERKQFEAELTRLARYPLLVIDEVGYIPFEPEAANLFFQLVSSRYERASLIVTSNKPFGRWGEVFGDDVVAAAMIDRLVHHAEVIALKGDSYRLKDRDLGRVPTATAEDQ